jgi:hypothetical protein
VASIFSVEEYVKQENRVKQVVSRASCRFLALRIHSRTLGRHVPPKRWLDFNGPLHNLYYSQNVDATKNAMGVMLLTACIWFRGVPARRKRRQKGNTVSDEAVKYSYWDQ